MPTLLSTALIAAAMSTSSSVAASSSVHLGTAQLFDSSQPSSEPTSGWEEPATEQPATEQPAEQPAETWDEPTAETPAAETEAPVSGPAPADGGEIATEAKEPPKLPRQKGIGLMVGAGISGAVGIASSAYLIVTVLNRCTGDDSVAGCIVSVPGMIGFTVLRYAANGAAIGLAAGGGVIRGKYDGVRSVVEGKPTISPVGMAASGGALIGIGVITSITMRTVGLISLIDTCGEKAANLMPEEAEDCFRKRMAGYFGGIQIGSSLTAGGAFMLAYGLSYRKAKRKAGENLATRFSIAPRITMDFTGISATGRF